MNVNISDQSTDFQSLSHVRQPLDEQDGHISLPATATSTMNRAELEVFFLFAAVVCCISVFIAVLVILLGWALCKCWKLSARKRFAQNFVNQIEDNEMLPGNQDRDAVAQMEDLIRRELNRAPGGNHPSPRPVSELRMSNDDIARDLMTFSNNDLNDRSMWDSTDTVYPPPVLPKQPQMGMKATQTWNFLNFINGRNSQPQAAESSMEVAAPHSDTDSDSDYTLPSAQLAPLPLHVPPGIPPRHDDWPPLPPPPPPPMLDLDLPVPAPAKDVAFDPLTFVRQRSAQDEGEAAVLDVSESNEDIYHHYEVLDQTSVFTFETRILPGESYENVSRIETRV